MHQSISAAPIPPPPPGQLWGICTLCQSLGRGNSKFGMARGSGICLPGVLTHVVSDSKFKHGGFYRKGPAVRHRVDRPWRYTCQLFLRQMHEIFISTWPGFPKTFRRFPKTSKHYRECPKMFRRFLNTSESIWNFADGFRTYWNATF